MELEDEFDIQAWVREFARDCRYLNPQVLPDGERWAALAPQIFTAAIIVGEIGNAWEYEDRWCYPSLAAASLALAAWDGRGEPTGWHRHPATGRRVSVRADEVDQDGNAVGGVGVTYVRF